jgi:hypothetical protein
VRQFLVGLGQSVSIQEIGHDIGVYKDFFIQRPATRGLLPRRQIRTWRANHSASLGSGSLKP